MIGVIVLLACSVFMITAAPYQENQNEHFMLEDLDDIDNKIIDDGRLINPEADDGEIEQSNGRERESMAVISDPLWFRGGGFLRRGSRFGFRSFRRGFRGFRRGFRRFRRPIRRTFRRVRRYIRRRPIRRAFRRARKYIRRRLIRRTFRRARKYIRRRPIRRAFRRARKYRRKRPIRKAFRRTRKYLRRRSIRRAFRRERKYIRRRPLRRSIRKVGRRISRQIRRKTRRTQTFLRRFRKGSFRKWLKRRKLGKKKGFWLSKKPSTSKKSWLKKYGRLIGKVLQNLLRGGSGSIEPGSGGVEPGSGGVEPGSGGVEPGSGGVQPGTGDKKIPVKVRFINIIFRNLAKTSATIVPSRTDASEVEIPPGQSRPFYYEEVNSGVVKSISFTALDIQKSSVSPLQLNNAFSYVALLKNDNKTIIRVNVTSLENNIVARDEVDVDEVDNDENDHDDEIDDTDQDASGADRNNHVINDADYDDMNDDNDIGESKLEDGVGEWDDANDNEEDEYNENDGENADEDLTDNRDDDEIRDVFHDPYDVGDDVTEEEESVMDDGKPDGIIEDGDENVDVAEDDYDDNDVFDDENE